MNHTSDNVDASPTPARSRAPLSFVRAGALLLLSAALACACDDGAGEVSETDTGTSAGATDSTNSGGTGSDSATGSGSGADSAGAAPSCDVPLTDWEQMMLDTHNEWRASVDPPAKFMRRLYWDTNLAQHAAEWVSSCNPKWPHSSEAYLSDFGGYKHIGENLAYCGGGGCEELPTVLDGSGLGSGWGWWDERQYYDWYNDEETWGSAPHYIHMVSSNTYALGCATQRCDAPGPNGWDAEWWWVSCLYGPRAKAYWVGTKPYDLGDGELIEPKASVFEKHPGLCGP